MRLPCPRGGESTVCTAEFLLLVVLTDKALDNADIRHALLNGRVERIYALLNDLKARESAADDKQYCDKQHRYRHAEDKRKVGAQRHRHYQCAYHHTRRAQTHAQQHVDEVLQLRYVVCQTCDKRARGKTVDIRERIALHLLVQVEPQVAAEKPTEALVPKYAPPTPPAIMSSAVRIIAAI